jgi:hypothetical protein
MTTAYPNKLVRAAVNNAFDAMLRAGQFPAVQYKLRPSGNCSYDNTEYNKHWASFVRCVDKWLKSVGFTNGAYTGTTKAAYEVAVSRAVACITPEEIIRGTQVAKFPVPETVEV